jgi:hypothetical protein
MPLLAWYSGAEHNENFLPDKGRIIAGPNLSMLELTMRILAVLLSLSIALFGCSPGDDKATETSDALPTILADKVFTHSKVYTVNDAQPWAEAIAVAGNRIVGNIVSFGSDVPSLLWMESSRIVPGFSGLQIHQSRLPQLDIASQTADNHFPK